MEVVNTLIDTDEALVNQFDSDAKRDAGVSGAAGGASSKLRKQPSEVFAAEGRQLSTFNVDEFNAVLDSPCTFHEGAIHTIRECSQFKRAFRAPEDPKRPRGDGDQSSSCRYNSNRWDDRRGRDNNGLRDDRRSDDRQPEDRRDERDLPPPPEAGNPNGPFQQAKRSINMIVGGLKASSSRRRYRKNKPAHPHQAVSAPSVVGATDHVLQG
jgi:hypothetical protein